MGGKKSGFNPNRSEFVHENAIEGDIEYHRSGGCFVTTKRAIAFVIIALLALGAVGALIYFYGAKLNEKDENRSSDIEKLLNDSINDVDDQLRLPPYITPIHYRLRIHPYLDENGSENFTFSGQVFITIQTSQETKQIMLHCEDLEIMPDDIKISTKKMDLKSLSQTIENPTNSSQLPLSNNSTIKLSNLEPIFSNTSTNASTSTAITRGFQISTPAPPKITSTASSVPAVDLNLTSTKPGNDPNLTKPTIKSNNLNIYKTNNVDTPITTPAPPMPTSSTTSSTTANLPYNTDRVTEINIKSFEKDANNSIHVINLQSNLQPNVNYTIKIKFSGKILNNLVGLYKTSYSTSKEDINWLLTTHLQPIFARRVFPCFDEPSFKSSFEISIARRTNMTTLSNMALKEVEPMSEKPGWVWDHFEPSPPMPTYLVAFTVLNFKNLVASSSKGGTTLKIWVPEEKLSNAKYALEISPKIFSYLENYFGVKYPLQKIDLVAIPELPQKATDNWGIILFRDSSLLLDNGSSENWKVKNSIFKTIVRKLTTQWLGNLVTMNWWSEMWLIEGFSTFMEDVVEGAIEPNLENLDSFSLRIEQTILDIDKLKSVRSLHSEVKDLSQIEQIFDDVAINKGSCLIRMLNYTLTEEVFKIGVQNYLKEWSFKCSNEDKFWESFTRVSRNEMVIPNDLTVKTIMDSWITQVGYPVVTVERNYIQGGAVINQTRFIQSSISSDHKWYIPLTYTRKSDNGAITTLWLKKETSLEVVNFTTSNDNNWILFNVDQAGFYRVNYDQRNWNLLQRQLMNDHEAILPSNRGQLLNDAFELAFAGLLDYHIPFELAKYLKLKERHYIPWNSVYNSLRSLEIIIGSTQYYGYFQQYVVNITKRVYDELGTVEKPGESQNAKLLRIFIIEAACSFNYEPCLEWAKDQYHNWMVSNLPDRTNFIPFHFREIVQCTAIKIGGQKEWEFLWRRTLFPLISPTNLKIAYSALGCTQEPWLINRYLERTLNRSIGLQNVPEVWKSIAHPVGLKAGFSFLRSNWNRMYSTYKHVNSIVTAIFEEFLSNLSTDIDLEDLTTFYKNHKENLHSVSSLMLNVVDRIKWRVDWAKTHLETVADLLRNNN